MLCISPDSSTSWSFVESQNFCFHTVHHGPLQKVHDQITGMLISSCLFLPDILALGPSAGLGGYGSHGDGKGRR